MGQSAMPKAEAGWCESFSVSVRTLSQWAQGSCLSPGRIAEPICPPHRHPGKALWVGGGSGSEPVGSIGMAGAG